MRGTCSASTTSTCNIVGCRRACRIPQHGCLHAHGHAGHGAGSWRHLPGPPVTGIQPHRTAQSPASQHPAAESHTCRATAVKLGHCKQTQQLRSHALSLLTSQAAHMAAALSPGSGRAARSPAEARHRHRRRQPLTARFPAQQSRLARTAQQRQAVAHQAWQHADVAAKHGQVKRELGSLCEGHLRCSGARAGRAGWYSSKQQGPALLLTIWGQQISAAGAHPSP